MKRIPNLFLSVGAIKASTSWLSEQLRHHPDVLATPLKEIHYFAHQHTDLKFLDRAGRLNAYKAYVAAIPPNRPFEMVRNQSRWFARYFEDPLDDEWFCRLFEGRGPQRYWAEYSNMNSIVGDAGWDHIVGLADNLKVSYTLRDPLDRLWSHVRYHSALKGVFRDLASWDETTCRNFLEAERLLLHVPYSDIIGKLRRHLDDDQLLLTYHEDFHARPLEEMRRVEAFLGISAKPYESAALGQVHNASPRMAMPEAFVRAVRPVILPELEKLGRIGVPVPASWQAIEERALA